MHPSSPFEASLQLSENPLSNPLSIASTNATHTPLLIGFDFGTNTSCLIGSQEGSPEILIKKAIPTVVGYPKKNLLSGILPSKQEVFFGQDALKYKAHLDLVYPMQKGIIANLDASKQFMQYLRSLILPKGRVSLKAVIGMPANTPVLAQEQMREVVSGTFEQILLIPEPFLAALGYRNEKRLSEANYLDPVRASLFVDIGAGTTDLCAIQGYHPEAKDLVTLNEAGDTIDQLLMEAVHAQYPEIALSTVKARALKETFSYVGPLKHSVPVKTFINGKPRQIDVGPSIGQACTQVVDSIVAAVTKLIGSVSPEIVEAVLHNIILTGGGSRINGIAEYMQEKLLAEGFEDPHVSTVGEHYKSFVALGAWKAALNTKPQHWQHLLGSPQGSI